MPVVDVNAGDEQVLMIACGANFSLCYTALGVVYYWGMLVPDDLSSIYWYPGFLTVSYPHHLSSSWDTFILTDLKATFREILACDVAGRVYHCDLNYTQTLKPYEPKRQALLGFGHRLRIGRSLHLFLDSVLCLSQCRLVRSSLYQQVEEGGETEEGDEPPELETLLENRFLVKLCDEEGGPHFESNEAGLASRLPVTVVLNNSEERLAVDYPGYNHKDALAKGVRDVKDKPDFLTFSPGLLGIGGPSDNQVRFQLSQPSLHQGDHSQLVLTLTPFQDGPFYLHVFLGS